MSKFLPSIKSIRKNGIDWEPFVGADTPGNKLRFDQTAQIVGKIEGHGVRQLVEINTLGCAHGHTAITLENESGEVATIQVDPKQLRALIGVLSLIQEFQAGQQTEPSTGDEPRVPVGNRDSGLDPIRITNTARLLGAGYDPETED